MKSIKVFGVIAHTSQNIWQWRDGGKTGIPQTSILGYTEIYTDRTFGVFYALRYIINFFSYALPVKEKLIKK